MMELWSKICLTLLPFDWVQHGFMQAALLGLLLIAPLFGLMGTLVVNNRMAFFSDALGHSALTGIAIGVLVGLNKPLLAMIIFSLMLSVIIIIVKNTNTASTDTIIGVFSSTAVALGILLLSKSGGFARFTSYLVGDILAIETSDIIQLFILLLVVLIFWAFSFNRLLLISINQSLAASRHIRVQLWEIIFTLLVAVVVTVSIQWVGLLLINALLILPAAAARNLSRSARGYQRWALIISFVSTIPGLILSYYAGTATGATVVLIAACIFFVSFIFKK